MARNKIDSPDHAVACDCFPPVDLAQHFQDVRRQIVRYLEACSLNLRRSRQNIEDPALTNREPWHTVPPIHVVTSGGIESKPRHVGAGVSGLHNDLWRRKVDAPDLDPATIFGTALPC